MGRQVYEQFTCTCGTVCTMLPHEKSGKLAPITKDTYEGGNIELTDDMFGKRTYRIVSKPEREAKPRHRRLNHFSNCPDRESFGGRKTG
jgi:hypothetical protein